MKRGLVTLICGCVVAGLSAAAGDDPLFPGARYAIGAYEKAVELGQVPKAHHTAKFAAYRLQVLRGERMEDEPDN